MTEWNEFAEQLEDWPITTSVTGNVFDESWAVVDDRACLLVGYSSALSVKKRVQSLRTILSYQCMLHTRERTALASNWEAIETCLVEWSWLWVQDTSQSVAKHVRQTWVNRHNRTSSMIESRQFVTVRSYPISIWRVRSIIPINTIINASFDLSKLELSLTSESIQTIFESNSRIAFIPAIDDLTGIQYVRFRRIKPVNIGITII